MAQSASPSQKGVFPTAARLCHANGPHPFCGEGAGPRKDVGCSSSGQGKEERDHLPQSSGQRRQSWKKAVAVSPPQPASPKFGCRKSRREMHPSSGKIKSPKGPLELMRPPRPQVKGNRLRKSCGCKGWKERSPGVGRDTSAAFPPPPCWIPPSPPRTSTLTCRRPRGSHQLPAFLQPPFPSIEHTKSPSKECSGASPDPGPHRAQEMEALWSVPASEASPKVNAPAGPLDGSALGKGLTMA